MSKITGQRITNIWTIDSHFALGRVGVALDDGTNARMTTNTIKQMVNEFTFDVIPPTGNMKYARIENPERIEEAQ